MFGRTEPSLKDLMAEIVDGRTDLVFEYLYQGGAARATDAGGVSLIQWCSYYGDASAVKFLLTQGESLDSLGEHYGLMLAAFNGHWRLCKFFLERGEDVNQQLPDTGESALHSTLCTTDRRERNLTMKVLLEHGANPNCVTNPSIPTGGFMRDCRTKGETPLHRAAAFGDEEAIQLLLDAGAKIDAKDMYGDSPLSWGSWYARPRPILRMLCYGEFRIR